MAITNVTQAEQQACRQEFGEAHDVQLAFAGECSWCGAEDPTIQEGHIDEATGNIYTASGELLECHQF